MRRKTHRCASPTTARMFSWESLKRFFPRTQDGLDEVRASRPRRAQQRSGSARRSDAQTRTGLRLRSEAAGAQFRKLQLTAVHDASQGVPAARAPVRGRRRRAGDLHRGGASLRRLGQL